MALYHDAQATTTKHRDGTTSLTIRTSEDWTACEISNALWADAERHESEDRPTTAASLRRLARALYTPTSS